MLPQKRVDHATGAIFSVDIHMVCCGILASQWVMADLKFLWQVCVVLFFLVLAARVPQKRENDTDHGQR